MPSTHSSSQAQQQQHHSSLGPFANSSAFVCLGNKAEETIFYVVVASFSSSSFLFAVIPAPDSVWFGLGWLAKRGLFAVCVGVAGLSRV